MKFEKATTFICYLAVWICFAVLAFVSVRIFLIGMSNPPPTTAEKFGECYERCTNKMREANPKFNPYNDTRCFERCLYIYQQGVEV